MDTPTPPDAGARRMAAGVLVLCTAMNFLSRGVSDTYAVFLLPLSHEFGADRAALTGVYSVYMLMYGLAAPAAGIVFDRLGPRALYGAGLACFGAAYLLAGSAGALWQLYLLIGFFGGIGSAAIGMVPASALVSRWFRRRLPSAMSVLYAGLGTGLLLLAPVAQWLIDAAGWRAAYRVLGAALLLLLPLLLVLPWRTIGAGHPGYAEPSPGPGARTGGGTPARTLRTPAFWGLFGVLFFTSFTSFTITVQLVAFLIETGFAPLEAASVYGAMGLLSVAGMLGSGALAERYGERRVATLSYCSTIAGIAMLALLEWTPAYTLLAAFALLFGAVQGSRGPLVATLAARLFARGGLGGVYGGISLGLGLGAALGSALAGKLHDLTGGYGAGFVLAAAGAIVGIALFRRVGALSAPATSHGAGTAGRPRS